MSEKHLFANDGSDWTTPPSPVDPDEARKADQELDPGKDGEGFSGTNEGHLSDTILQGSGSKNDAAPAESDEENDDNG